MQQKKIAIKLTETSDNKILELCRNEDSLNFGFDLLVKKYQQRVYWQVRKMVIDHNDTDDLVQDIFIKIWKNLDSFREDAKLFTWIYRIATNEVLSFLNRKKRRYFLSLSSYEDHLYDKLQDDHFFTGDDIQKKFQKALLKLPPKQRLVFNMKYYEELKYNEISEILGTSVGALKASYHHAVKKIKDFVTDN